MRGYDTSAPSLWCSVEDASCPCSWRPVQRSRQGIKTLLTQDTSDLRHFGTGAEVSVRHFGTGAEVSGHFGISAEMSVSTNVRKTLRYRSVFGVVCAIVCCDITIASRIGLAWRLCSRRNRFNAVYLKHDGTAIDWADRTASASHSRSRCRQRVPAMYSSQYSLRPLCNAAKDLRCSRIACGLQTAGAR